MTVGPSRKLRLWVGLMLSLNIPKRQKTDHVPNSRPEGARSLLKITRRCVFCRTHAVVGLSKGRREADCVRAWHGTTKPTRVVLKDPQFILRQKPAGHMAQLVCRGHRETGRDVLANSSHQALQRVQKKELLQRVVIDMTGQSELTTNIVQLPLNHVRSEWQSTPSRSGCSCRLNARDRGEPAFRNKIGCG